MNWDKPKAGKTSPSAMRKELRRRYREQVQAKERALHAFQGTEERQLARPTTEKELTGKQVPKLINDMTVGLQAEAMIDLVTEKIPGLSTLIKLGAKVYELNEGDEEAVEAKRRLQIVSGFVQRRHDDAWRVFNRDMDRLEDASPELLEVLIAQEPEQVDEKTIVEDLREDVRKELHPEQMKDLTKQAAEKREVDEELSEEQEARQ
jgi:hypothetical protein